MMLTNLPRIKVLLFFIGLLLPELMGFKQGDKSPTFIELQDQRLAINPKEFYVADVIDERKDKVFARILSASVPPVKGTGNLSVEMKGGFATVKSYIENNLSANHKLRPVIITIKTLKISESPLRDGRVDGQIKMELSFGLQKGDEVTHLTAYTGSAAYQRKGGPPQQVEPVLRSTINNGLIYLNNWMNAQADNNIKLAKGVKVSFADYNEPEEGDTIYYNINRPLKWTDFRAKPQYSSKYGAEVFASLGYTEDVKLINGIINIKLAMKVYLPKSACWVKEFGAGDYQLNHEQRHFDIVKLVAERFKLQISQMKLSTDNYDGPINVAYFDALREIDKLQKQYDSETQHSINTYQQQQWCDKIDKELAALGINFTSS